METAEQVDEANSIGPDNPCTTAALAAPYITDLVARSDGHVVAKAQVVALPGEPAYVSDMYTAPWARHRGYGSALLSCIHQIVQRTGGTECILVPSRQTRKDHFYEGRGYKEALPLSLLIPTLPQI